MKDKKPSFAEANIVSVFKDILRKTIEKENCIVPVYCFMPDHLHLLISGQSDASDLWKTAINYKQQTGFWLSSHRPELKWQKDFYDHIIRSDDKLEVHIRYILDNPVRKGLVLNWRDYSYSGSLGCDLNGILYSIM